MRVLFRPQRCMRPISSSVIPVSDIMRVTRGDSAGLTPVNVVHQIKVILGIVREILELQLEPNSARGAMSACKADVPSRRTARATSSVRKDMDYLSFLSSFFSFSYTNRLMR
jgi:hypothetical protein